MTLTPLERETYEERAGICQHSGKLSKPEAERQAMTELEQERERA